MFTWLSTKWRYIASQIRYFSFIIGSMWTASLHQDHCIEPHLTLLSIRWQFHWFYIALDVRKGVVRKHLKSYAELIFITAPHDVPVEVVDDCESTSNDSSPPIEIDDTEKSWWFNSEDRTFNGTNINGPAFGFDISLKMVEEAWRTLGPFHGLLGFSQGGCFAGMICSLANRGSKFMINY